MGNLKIYSLIEEGDNSSTTGFVATDQFREKQRQLEEQFKEEFLNELNNQIDTPFTIVMNQQPERNFVASIICQGNETYTLIANSIQHYMR
ncbi:hypothetical protein OO009_02985 [Flavobacteriaceae bacterium KMM 6897]|nr:hypothetical protein [Flavobacteriaceae bacterium KMM 6897]